MFEQIHVYLHVNLYVLHGAYGTYENVFDEIPSFLLIVECATDPPKGMNSVEKLREECTRAIFLYLGRDVVNLLP